VLYDCKNYSAIYKYMYVSETFQNKIIMINLNCEVLWNFGIQTSNEVTDENDDIDRVWWIVSKVGSGSETVIQVVIANDGDGSTAQVVAYDAKRHIQNGIDARIFYSLPPVENKNALYMYDAEFVWSVAAEVVTNVQLIKYDFCS